MPGARLVRVSDRTPGIRRVRCGSGFRYRGSSGRWVRDRGVLRRIRALAIPPAWEEVWICALPHGHVQATGYDARGRKQYRYHPHSTARQSAEKFAGLAAFGRGRAPLRRRVRRDLARPGLPRTKVVACLVRLLDESLIRVGHREYLRSNGSHGLTTLDDRQVHVEGDRLHFHFPGKGGTERDVLVEDRRAAEVVRRCRRLPRRRLFQARDPEGSLQPVTAADVRGYLRRGRGAEFDAKDFRTWGASAGFAGRLLAAGPGAEVRSARELKRREMAALRGVAERLGNTPAVARRSYVHPAILEAYPAGRLERCAAVARRRRAPRELRHAERTLLRLLEEG